MYTPKSNTHKTKYFLLINNLTLALIKKKKQKTNKNIL